MNRLFVIGLGIVCAMASRGVYAQPAGGTAAAETVVLDETSYWRCWLTWKTPMLRKDDQLLDTGELNVPDLGAKGLRADTPWPPEGWHKGDFDDSDWSRWRLSRTRRAEYAFGFKTFGAFGPCLAMQCIRARFTVDDPAAVKDGGLKLSVSYRGGAVVYLNGVEIGRGHLPKDARPDTLAEDYPKEAFVKPDGQCIRAEHGDPAANKDRVALRIRKLDIDVPAAAVKKGVNVLAIELHRAPYWGSGLEKENMNHESVWSTAGLASVKLTASAGVTANTSRPAGLQVWNVTTMSRLTPADYGDPHDSIKPIRIVAARNGHFAGRLVVSGDQALRGVKAQISDLKHQTGSAVLPASSVAVLYTTRDDAQALRHRVPDGGYWDPLNVAPPEELAPAKTPDGSGAVQPIWIKVRVPADAAPGDYAGRLTVTADGLAGTAVPVQLKVIDWKLPDSKDYLTHLGLVQSPDSVAMQYKVPLWSERHWELLEKSFELMGQLGVKNVYVPMICRTNFGNEQSMVRFVKQSDGTLKADWAVFDRYLDLAQKHLRPDVVCLYVWDRYTGEWRWAGKGEREGQGALVTVVDPATGQTADFEGPRLGTAESKAFWEPVYKELRQRLEKRGLLDVVMMGLNGDAYRPTDAMAKMFKELLPEGRWVSNSHADARGGNVAGISVGYNTAVYVNMFPPPPAWDAKRKCGWQLKFKADIFPRSAGPATKAPMGPISTLGLHRIICEAALLANCSGVGRAGVDFWPVQERSAIRAGRKHSVTLGARYADSCWDQLNLDRATEALVAPGPNGAIPTERFECVREGVLDCEARIFIEKALADPAVAAKLPADLVARCQQTLDERAWRIRAACMGGWNWYETTGSAGLSEKLFTVAGELARAIGSR